jgi:hypothetical protein
MKAWLLMIAAGFMASSAMAANINVKVCRQGQPCDPDSSTPDTAPPGVVDYQIVAKLTNNTDNEGLCLIGLSARYTHGALTTQAVCPNTPPMSSFQIPDGLTNPDGCGGTLIGGELVQIGGATNTIRNTAGNADFPIGTPPLGVAWPASPLVVATGSFTAVAGAGTNQFQLFDVFANTIKDGELLTEAFLETQAAGVGVVTPLNIAGVTTAEVLKWESVRPHEQGVGNVALEIPNTDVFSEPRTGVTQLLVTFTSAINPATATPANVVICGKNLANSDIDLSGITVTTAATASNTQMEINFNPKLPNVGRYKVAISGVQSAGGGAVIAGSGGLSRIFTALQGDAGGAAGGQGDRRVNATDVGGCRNLALAAQSDPIDPALLLEVRCDANDDGRVNATDVGGIRGFALQGAPFDARNIDPPVCP